MSPTAAAITITPTLRRRPGLTEQAAVAAVDQASRRLRLPTVKAVLDEALTVAGKEQLTYQGFLAELLVACPDDLATLPVCSSTVASVTASAGAEPGAPGLPTAIACPRPHNRPPPSGRRS